jgi:hypothetical protein
MKEGEIDGNCGHIKCFMGKYGSIKAKIIEAD